MWFPKVISFTVWNWITEERASMGLVHRENLSWRHRGKEMTGLKMTSAPPPLPEGDSARHGIGTGLLETTLSTVPSVSAHAFGRCCLHDWKLGNESQTAFSLQGSPSGTSWGNLAFPMKEWVWPLFLGIRAVWAVSSVILSIHQRIDQLTGWLPHQSHALPIILSFSHLIWLLGVLGWQSTFLCVRHRGDVSDGNSLGDSNITGDTRDSFRKFVLVRASHVSPATWLIWMPGDCVVLQTTWLVVFHADTGQRSCDSNVQFYTSKNHHHCYEQTKDVRFLKLEMLNSANS